MGWKKVSLILGIVLILIISAYWTIFGSAGYDSGVNQALNSYDLSGCQKIPSFKYMIRYNYGLLGGAMPYLKTQRASCIEDVSHAFKLIEDEKGLLVFLEALKLNKPELCNGYECLDKIKEKYQNPSVCSYYFQNDSKGYYQYSYVFECQGYLIAVEKQKVDYCEQFSEDLRDYCYIIIVREYNKLRTIAANPLRIHQTSEGKDYFYPKPDIKNMCSRINDSALKSPCDYVFEQFESWETPTLND